MGRTAPQSGGWAFSGEAALAWWTRSRAGGTGKDAGAGVIGAGDARGVVGGGPSRLRVRRPPGEGGMLREARPTCGQWVHAEGVSGVVVRRGEHERAAFGEGVERLLVRLIVVGPRAQLRIGTPDFKPGEDERCVTETHGPEVRGQQPGETVRGGPQPPGSETWGTAAVGGEQDFPGAAEVVGGGFAEERDGRSRESTCRGRWGEHQHVRAHRLRSWADSLALIMRANWVWNSSTCAGVRTSSDSQLPPSS